ncbi:MAG: methionine ABC transporter permease [Helicobacter sp.]|nr:methionine ABC transporter permease [Helicobacter sp.]
MLSLLIESTIDTLIMVFFSTFFSLFFGLPLAVFLYGTQKKSLFPKPTLNKIVGSIVNVVRSFPFIILIVVLLPFSRLIVGTSIGVQAAIVSLSIAAIPFMARLFESALNEIDKGLIEATISMGASKFTVIKMILKEMLPALINVTTIAIISITGYSAMAGALGAGGLGDLAIRVGFQSNQPDILLATIIVIIVFVQIIQSLGDFLSGYLKRKRG